MKKFLPRLAAFLIRMIAATLRVREEDHAGVLRNPDHEPMIFAFWHNRMFLMSPFFQRYCPGRTSYTFISRSKDGQFITDVAEAFGVKALRGSSSKHGAAAALAALRQAGDERSDICITPDGPRGPLYQIQPGVLRLAQATGRPVVTVTTHLTWKIVGKGWDKFQVPLPFSRCRLVLSEPIRVPGNASDEELATLEQKLARELGT